MGNRAARMASASGLKIDVIIRRDTPFDDSSQGLLWGVTDEGDLPYLWVSSFPIVRVRHQRGIYLTLLHLPVIILHLSFNHIGTCANRPPQELLPTHLLHIFRCANHPA